MNSYRSLIIDRKQFLYAWTVIFPIVPVYFDFIGGISFRNILILLATFWVLMNGILPRLDMKTSGLFMYGVFSLLLNLFHGILVTGVFEILFFLVITFGFYQVADEKWVNKLIDGIIAISFIICILGLIESFTGVNVFLFLNNSGTVLLMGTKRFSLTRVMGFTTMTTNYGMYMFLVESLVLYRLVNTDGRKCKYIVAYIVIFLNVVLTLSRGPILALILTQVILLFKVYGGRVVIAFLFALPPIALILMVFSQGASVLMNFIYMFLAIFDERFASQISTAFGSNVGGVGNRFELYGWVWEKLKPNYWLGSPDEFYYRTKMANGYWLEKESIEVHYLYILFKKGIIGLVGEIIFFFRMIYLSFVTRANKLFNKKDNISFSYVCCVTFLFYYITLFTVTQQEDKILFLIMCSLMITIRRIGCE